MRREGLPGGCAAGDSRRLADRRAGAGDRRAAHRRMTVTPPENAESCSSAFTALTPLGMSNASSPCTVLPGLMSLKNTLSDPLALLRSTSALVLTSYFRPLAS